MMNLFVFITGDGCGRRLLALAFSLKDVLVFLDEEFEKYHFETYPSMCGLRFGFHKEPLNPLVCLLKLVIQFTQLTGGSRQ